MSDRITRREALERMVVYYPGHVAELVLAAHDAGCDTEALFWAETVFVRGEVPPDLLTAMLLAGFQKVVGAVSTRADGQTTPPQYAWQPAGVPWSSYRPVEVMPVYAGHVVLAGKP